MYLKDILSKCDHTLLKPYAKLDDILELCKDGIRYGTASVCIPACYVAPAKNFCEERIKICTVIGFPNGYSTAEAKCFEAKNAVKNSADEIDMVINIGFLKDERYDYILKEINEVKKACCGKLLKVIVETCYLSNAEKIKMCGIVSQSEADYIKTSTGFGTDGATREDISLFAAHIKNGKKIKAAGGIKTLQDAEDFINLGASRLGTSQIVKLVKETEGIK